MCIAYDTSIRLTLVKKPTNMCMMCVVSQVNVVRQTSHFFLLNATVQQFVNNDYY